MSSEHISALVADDHPVVRIGMRRLLESNGIGVVAEAATGEEAYRLYDLHRPDMVLMDMRMPGIGGLEAVRRIRRRDADAKIMMLSISDSDALFSQAVHMGVAGYLTKSAAPAEIVTAVRRVAAGEKHFDTTLAGRLFSAGGESAPRPLLSALTPREFEVFRLLAEGHSVNDIAAILSISPKTAGVHHTRIMHKLDIRSPAQLVRLAFQQGLIAI
ncbi:MAG: DNA-binding response regulator [Gammaproteobacteria bacterium HGW-Gammaproteobacteria-1]|jgi:two-component system invasion response regulator UvrY|nr:MAG: DNA-binding response regulator [Gammaproteobacteria bacterium HGW-Gammaproteobacteria-1]